MPPPRLTHNNTTASTIILFKKEYGAPLLSRIHCSSYSRTITSFHLCPSRKTFSTNPGWKRHRGGVFGAPTFCTLFLVPCESTGGTMPSCFGCQRTQAPMNRTSDYNCYLTRNVDWKKLKKKRNKFNAFEFTRYVQVRQVHFRHCQVAL